MGKKLNVPLGILVVLLLAGSVYFSISSFTGYIVAEDVSQGANILSIVLFLAGLSGSYFLLKR